MKTKTAILIVIVVVAALDISAAAQANAQPIALSIFALDGKGNPATDVTLGDLIVEDGDRTATITSISRDDRPLRLGIVIDKSNSQRRSDVYKAAMQGLNPFLKQVMRPDSDQVFFETFDTTVNDPTDWLTAAQLGNAHLDVQPGGGSSLFDAVDLACKQRMTGQSARRRVLLILTDGGDNQSRVNLDTAIASAQQTGTVVIALSTREQSNVYQRQDTAGVLKRFAEGTGGFDFDDIGAKQLPKVFAQIAQLLDAMLQVTFVSETSGASREPHRIQVKPSSRKKLRIVAAKRYFPSS